MRNLDFCSTGDQSRLGWVPEDLYALLVQDFYSLDDARLVTQLVL